MGLADLARDLKRTQEHTPTSASTAVDRANNIKDNLAQSLELMTQDLLKTVQEGKIEFNSPQDVKNLIMAYQSLTSEQTNNDATPQISGDIVNFYNNELHLPEGTEIKTKDITNTLEGMSAEDVQRMIEGREVAGNNENIEKM